MLMRGGTSKGAYFLADDLPADAGARDAFLMQVMGTPDAQDVEGIANAMALRVVCSSLALLVGVIGVWQWVRGGRGRRACAWLLVLLSLVPAVGEYALIQDGSGSSWALVFTLVQCGVVATLLLASPTLRTGPRA